MAKTTCSTEGWTWTYGSRKWHYYREKRSICGSMLIFVHPSEGYELGNNDSKDNCAACRREIAKKEQKK